MNSFSPIAVLRLFTSQPPAPSWPGTSTPGPFRAWHLNPQPLLLKEKGSIPSPSGEG